MQMKNHTRISTCRFCSKIEREAWFSREFETCQARRIGIDISCEGEHVKTTPEHFWMEQHLQLAFSLAMGANNLNLTA